MRTSQYRGMKGKRSDGVRRISKRDGKMRVSQENYSLRNSRPSSLPARVAFRVSFTRNATRAGNEEGRLFSQATGERDPVELAELVTVIRVNLGYANIM